MKFTAQMVIPVYNDGYTSRYNKVHPGFLGLSQTVRLPYNLWATLNVGNFNNSRYGIDFNLIHHFNALAYLFCRKAFWMGIFFFVDAEGTMIAAVVRNKNGNSRSAFTRLVWMSCCLNCTCSSMYLRLYHILIRLKFFLPSRECPLSRQLISHRSVISYRHGHLLLS